MHLLWSLSSMTHVLNRRISQSFTHSLPFHVAQIQGHGESRGSRQGCEEGWWQEEEQVQSRGRGPVIDHVCNGKKTMEEDKHADLLLECLSPLSIRHCDATNLWWMPALSFPPSFSLPPALFFCHLFHQSLWYTDRRRTSVTGTSNWVVAVALLCPSLFLWPNHS